MISISQMALSMPCRFGCRKRERKSRKSGSNIIDKAAEHFSLLRVTASAKRTREVPVTLAGKLSVVTAYLAIAFVGAIVLGVI